MGRGWRLRFVLPIQLFVKVSRVLWEVEMILYSILVQEVWVLRVLFSPAFLSLTPVFDAILPRPVVELIHVMVVVLLLLELPIRIQGG